MVHVIATELQRVKAVDASVAPHCVEKPELLGVFTV
jgi:hypothetical protein